MGIKARPAYPKYPATNGHVAGLPDLKLDALILQRRARAKKADAFLRNTFLDRLQ
jgi:hypothetical protein